MREVRERLLVEPANVDPSLFPSLENLSAGFLFDAIPRPRMDEPCEIVSIPFAPRTTRYLSKEEIKVRVFLTEWNAAWEAGSLRHQLFLGRIPRSLSWLGNHRGRNIAFAPLETPDNYHRYVPLYHLIPAQTLQRFGLPLVEKGFWPHWTERSWLNEFLPRDFEHRLSQAFAFHIWPLLMRGSGLRAFSRDDSIRVLSHNLDYWLPYADMVVRSRLDQFPRASCNSKSLRDLMREARSDVPPGVSVNRPRKGGNVWSGVEEALIVTKELVEAADKTGGLRALIDVVRSNRVEEDFSSKWSNAREDFERKLYRKRAKIKVSFVELRDTLPVHSPTAELHEDLLWQDFLGLLSPKERRVIVCIRSGSTRLGDIAKSLGYANHSPVSKAMKAIRVKASAFLGAPQPIRRR
jgi:hypothetical protein